MVAIVSVEQELVIFRQVMQVLLIPAVVDRVVVIMVKMVFTQVAVVEVQRL